MDSPAPGPGACAIDHGLPLDVMRLDRRTYARAMQCVHCGLCLPACPTYTQTGLEADSPRGRIHLMKGMADGGVAPTESVLKHLDLCLDCRACETACPSGVVYHELIEETRTRLAPHRAKTFVDRLVEATFLHVFTSPWRLKAALLPVRVIQKLGLWHPLRSTLAPRLPPQLDKMQQMLPPRGPLWESNLAAFYPATTSKRATVGFFAGCVGSVLFQDVNRQTIDLLRHAGCDVLVVQDQVCCGAIHHHAGRAHDAEAMARRNIDAFLGVGPGRGDPREGAEKKNVGDGLAARAAAASSAGPFPVDFIVTNIAGCGAMLRDYAAVLRDDPPYAERARQFVDRMRDASELLVELNPPRPTRSMERTVTYHDACHLAHGQKITTPPRALLSWIKGLKVIPLPESDMCCGAAGTYNLTQPAMARDLAERKIRHIRSTGARMCVTANVGCAMQIQSEADRLGDELHVVHPMTLLHEAYFGGA